jgi:hypothetical protein
VFKRLRKPFRKPMRLGGCYLELFTIDDGNPFRADYTIFVNDKRFSKEFFLTRCWPLFLEHNIGKVNSENGNAVLSGLPLLISDYESGRELKIPNTPREDEMPHACFTDELFLGKHLYINNQFNNVVLRKPIVPNKVDIAFEKVAIWTFGLALSQLDRKYADELKFFVAYGLRKWQKTGYPKAISAFNTAWDFSNIDGMIKEWNTWESN